MGIHEIDEASRLIQEAVSPEANIIWGANVDDTLGDELRVTVIAAGFDGGAPTIRKVERRPFSTPTTSESEAPATAAPVAAPAVAAYEPPTAATSVIEDAFGDEIVAAPAQAPAEVTSRSFLDDEDPITAIVDTITNAGPKPQSEDGTFGDDLDIPEFLR
jgi:cell division protein FtsZ